MTTNSPHVSCSIESLFHLDWELNSVGDGMTEKDQQVIANGIGSLRHPVAVVMAGAGARGAYEAGALAQLLPVLEENDLRPTIFVGTSAGAINAALFAGLAHMSAKEAADRAIEAWSTITKNKVFKPVIRSGLPIFPRALLGLIDGPGRLCNLLDTSPLLKTFHELLDWQQLHENTQESQVAGPEEPRRKRQREPVTLAVAMTSCATGRTQIHVEGPRAKYFPPHDDNRALDYIPTAVEPEHIQASSAIPIAFSPVKVGTEWFMDGGVRLNAPIKPAVEAKAGSVIALATHPARYEPAIRPDKAGRKPPIEDAISQILQGALIDRMVEDFSELRKISKLVASGGKATSPNGRTYLSIPSVFIGPHSRSTLGTLASSILGDRFTSPLQRLRHPDLALLAFLLGPGPSRGELLSYLFFEPEFIKAAILEGQRDAQIMIDEATFLPNGNGTSTSKGQPSREAPTKK